MVSALYLLFFFLLLNFTIAQNSGNISLGSSLNENSSWLSPSSEFAFGFHPLPIKNHFLLAIWFEKLPEKTIVWSANGDNPVKKGSKVELTTTGDLLLTDHQGRRVWKAETGNKTVTSAEMLDTGNFVLRTRNSGFGWQSFDNPTDTILPRQVLGNGSKLCSRLTETDYSHGRFQLRLENDGNFILYQVNIPTQLTYDAYWASATNGSSFSQLAYNQSGRIYLYGSNRSSHNLNKHPLRSFYQRATLDFDGVFRQYVYSKGSKGGNWSVVISVPDNICLSNWSYDTLTGSGICGFNSFCRLEEEGRPNCTCLPGYSSLDKNNRFGGCKPDFILQACVKDEAEAETRFDIRELPNTSFKGANYEQFNVNKDKCKEACLGDCTCAAAYYFNTTCYKKKLPFSNGRNDPSIPGKILVKVRDGIVKQPHLPTDRCKKQKSQKPLILAGAVVLGSSVSLNFFLLTVICLAIFYSYHEKLLPIYPDSGVLGKNMRSFTYKELEEATNGFREDLGRGAFGTVYKGVLASDTRNCVAVKRLDKVVQEGEREFKTEVSTIGQTYHRNLVRLLGFCNEGANRLLVYEFMSNGSLASFIFGSMRPKWNQRMHIVSGIARGLVYLHEECSTQIIHCDIKPQNILLDDYFTARISDFGLAKLLKTDQTRSLSGIRGTKGYVAPEWFKNVTISAKVDVYSFGVLLLEIICCRKNLELEVGNEEKVILVDWAYMCYKGGRLDSLVENDEEAMNDIRRLERLVTVALWCIQEDSSLRPSMKRVTQMIEGLVEVPVPLKPFSLGSID